MLTLRPGFMPYLAAVCARRAAERATIRRILRQAPGVFRLKPEHKNLLA